MWDGVSPNRLHDPSYGEGLPASFVTQVGVVLLSACDLVDADSLEALPGDQRSPGWWAVGRLARNGARGLPQRDLH